VGASPQRIGRRLVVVVGHDHVPETLRMAPFERFEGRIQ
jgi:hypothetical protein